MAVHSASRRLRALLAGLLALGVVGLAGFVIWCVDMPGSSHSGALPPLDRAQRATAERLRETVVALALEIGPRNALHPEELQRANELLRDELLDRGLEVGRQLFQAGGARYENLVVELSGHAYPDEIVVVGAHYDTAGTSPGADDNASGVALLLELAERARDRPRSRTLRFVLFAAEEPPFYGTEDMGSRHYARAAADRLEAIVAMVSLESLGCYRDAEGSQRYPPPLGLLYPSRGDFVAFVGNTASRSLVRTAIARFRSATAFPSEGIAAPGWIPGVGWSDHWSFWREGFPAVMVTDTAPFRYAHYHSDRDLPDQLDYERMARVADGLDQVVRELEDPLL